MIYGNYINIGSQYAVMTVDNYHGVCLGMASTLQEAEEYSQGNWPDDGYFSSEQPVVNLLKAVKAFKQMFQEVVEACYLDNKVSMVRFMPTSNERWKSYFFILKKVLKKYDTHCLVDGNVSSKTIDGFITIFMTTRQVNWDKYDEWYYSL